MLVQLAGKVPLFRRNLPLTQQPPLLLPQLPLRLSMRLCWNSWGTSLALLRVLGLPGLLRFQR